MKLFIVTFYKLKMMASDKVFFVAMIIIPVFIAAVAGYALRNEKMNVVPIAVVDEDCSEYSAALSGRLKEKEGLEIREASRENALEMLKNNRIEEVFVIKKGFQEKIIHGGTEGIIDMYKSPSSFSAEFVKEVVAGEAIRFITAEMAADWIIQRYNKLGIPAGDKLVNEVFEHVNSQWEPEPLMTVNYAEIESGEAEEVKQMNAPLAAASSLGLIVAFVMFYVVFSSGWLIEERKNGTLKRLVSGPGALAYSYWGSILALARAGTAQLVLFSGIARFVFGVELLRGFSSYPVLLSYLLCAISLGVFLSSVFRTAAQMQAFAPVFALMTGFIGGCFWNFAEMPQRMRILSMLTPQGWALKGINTALSGRGHIQEILLPVLVLSGISLLLMPLSYVIINRQARA